MLETSAEIEVSALPSCINSILTSYPGHENVHATYRLEGWCPSADQAARSQPRSLRHSRHPHS